MENSGGENWVSGK